MIKIIGAKDNEDRKQKKMLAEFCMQSARIKYYNSIVKQELRAEYIIEKLRRRNIMQFKALNL